MQPFDHKTEQDTFLEKIVACIDLLKKDYSSAFDKYLTGHKIYRGMKAGSNVENNILIADSSKAPPRRSANTHNFYTYIIDNSKDWKRFPKRSMSFICSTNARSAGSYGIVYQVFPVNGTKIGVCPSRDFWAAFEHEPRFHGHSLFTINNQIHDLYIALMSAEKNEKENPISYPEKVQPFDKSIESFKQGLQQLEEIIVSNHITNPERYNIFLKKFAALETYNRYMFSENYFKSLAQRIIEEQVAFKPGGIWQWYEDGLNPKNNNIKLTTIEKFSIKEFDDYGHEVWFSGKAMFIEVSITRVIDEVLKQL